MVMRFRGGGVGHKATREATRIFEEQHGTLHGVYDSDEMDEDWEDESNDEHAGTADSGSDEDAGDDSESESDSEEAPKGVSEEQALAEVDDDAEDLEDEVDDEDYEGYATP